MRTSTFFAGIAASAALSMGLVGVASAAPAATTTGSAAAVFVSPTSAAPGATVQISGTCAMPTSGTDFPTVTSVTSPAFSGSASFTDKAPDSFSGTAKIASSVPAGSYPVTLTCSNGTAASTVQITGSAPRPTPNPAPAPAGGGTHHGSTSGGGTGGTSSTGAYSSQSGTFGESDTTVTEQAPAEQDSGWNGWEIAGVAVLGVAAAGVGGYAVARRNRQRTDV
ncbi:hypothetical protein [Pseudonocardia humida]|uniref:Secreted protein n=1 Tax=Pseudonocardia humida TaxID=2800819 RepID=A0ABT1A0C5_9PSEU|nr:hypothetical protein [Pseudonocardia humida]MCO1656452.1 hypothetical protein [Pseudonocardia humida]